MGCHASQSTQRVSTTYNVTASFVGKNEKADLILFMNKNQIVDKKKSEILEILNFVGYGGADGWVTSGGCLP